MASGYLVNKIHNVLGGLPVRASRVELLGPAFLETASPSGDHRTTQSYTFESPVTSWTRSLALSHGLLASLWGLQ